VAASALAPRQRRRIVFAAQAFLTHRADLAELDLRFDVMLVAPLQLPRHWRAAWRSDD
jgi:putative endonuclease